MSDPREYVVAAVDAILTKAYSTKNLPKGTWKTMDGALIRRLIATEVAELLHALDEESDQAVLLEAADVMNFAAMLVTREQPP